MLAKDVRPMPKNQFVQVVVPLYYQGHAYRAGTRIRVTIAAPNGSQPVWSFSETQPKGKAAVAIAFSKTMPSSLFLPVVPGCRRCRRRSRRARACATSPAAPTSRW